MSLSIDQEKELFRVGMEGVIVKIPADLENIYANRSLFVGTRIKITFVSNVVILKCENEQGEWMPFLPSEILITKLQ